MNSAMGNFKIAPFLNQQLISRGTSLKLITNLILFILVIRYCLCGKGPLKKITKLAQCHSFPHDYNFNFKICVVKKVEESGDLVRLKKSWSWKTKPIESKRPNTLKISCVRNQAAKKVFHYVNCKETEFEMQKKLFLLEQMRVSFYRNIERFSSVLNKRI